jgi:predicted DNA-binding protein
MNLRLTVELPPDIRCRLAIESAMTGKSNGAIVAELIDKHVDLPEDPGRFAADSRRTSPAPAAVASGSAVKKTSLHLPALTSLRLAVYSMKTGEDRKSTVIRLITWYITPWATYDPRTWHLRSRRNGRRGSSDDRASISEPDAA